MTNIYFKTFGCALNHADTETMAGLLKSADFNIVKSIEDADVIIINSCTVKGKTENTFFNLLDKFKQEFPHKHIIISGCISQTDPEKLQGYSLLGTSQISNIVEVVEETINDNSVELLVKEHLPRLNLPKIRKNSIIEIIPICSGCLGNPCAYCKVKDARGSLHSYPLDNIIIQLKSALREGVKEIWLTAQDTGCYGKDIGSSLPELLKKVIQVPGDFKVRLGMLNPNHVMEYLDELIEVFSSDKIFKFLHIPVQAGNDDILKSMRRQYSVKDFKMIISRFKAVFPHISIATDIIIGFPGESEDQFNDSLNLIKEIKPDVLNISRFWPRPKTEAALMDNQIHGQVSKKRSQLMTDIFHNISRMQNEHWLNWKGNVLIDEIGKDDSFVARNISYKPVIVKGNYKLGDTIFVKVNRISIFDLRAY